MRDSKRSSVVRYYLVNAVLFLCLTLLGIASCDIMLDKHMKDETEGWNGQQIEQTIQHTINGARAGAHQEHIEHTTL